MNLYENQRWNQVLRKGKHFLLRMRYPSWCPLCRIQEWNVLMTTISWPTDYHSLLKTFQILIDNSLKHDHVVILNPCRHIDCFSTFSRSRKPKSGHLMRAQTKYKTNFCHFGTYFLSYLSWLVLMESSELP